MMIMNKIEPYDTAMGSTFCVGLLRDDPDCASGIVSAEDSHCVCRREEVGRPWVVAVLRSVVALRTADLPWEVDGRNRLVAVVDRRLLVLLAARSLHAVVVAVAADTWVVVVPGPTEANPVWTDQIVPAV